MSEAPLAQLVAENKIAKRALYATKLANVANHSSCQTSGPRDNSPIDGRDVGSGEPFKLRMVAIAEVIHEDKPHVGCSRYP